MTMRNTDDNLLRPKRVLQLRRQPLRMLTPPTQAAEVFGMSKEPTGSDQVNDCSFDNCLPRK